MVHDAPFNIFSFLSIIVNTVCKYVEKCGDVYVYMDVCKQNIGGRREWISGKNLLSVYWKPTIKWGSVQCK